MKYVTILVLLGAVGAAGWVGMRQFETSQPVNLPFAVAKRGEFVAIVSTRGEIKAGRAVQIYAPIVPNLRVSWLAEGGEVIHEGDPMIRFDAGNGQNEQIQKEAAVRQAQATLDQAIAQAKITEEHDAADLTDARYKVQLAELNTAANEFVARIQAEQKQIDLDVAKQKLRVLEAEVAQHRVSDEAKQASLTRQRDQAQFDLDLTRRRLGSLEIKSPVTGYFIVSTNYSSNPQNPQPFKIGDTVVAGMNLAEIPDMNSLLIDVTIAETDRGRVAVGNDVIVRVDALPEVAIPAKLTQISPLAELALEFPLRRSFRGYAALSASADSRLRPGMNGGMDIVVERIPDAITIPAQALFTRDGKPAVYIVGANDARPVEVEVLARNPDEIAINGIDDGARVALVEPGSEGKAQNKSSSSPAPGKSK